MRPKMKIKKNDEVVVLTGRDKGKKGKVIGVFPREARALVAGVHMVKRHMRASPQTGAGGIVERESKIHISNIAVVDPKTGDATRIGYTWLKDGRKVRRAKKSGEVLDNA